MPKIHQLPALPGGSDLAQTAVPVVLKSAVTGLPVGSYQVPASQLVSPPPLASDIAAALQNRVAGSLRFPLYNRFAKAISALKQSTGNMPGLFANAAKAPVSGTFFAIFRLPVQQVATNKQVRIIGSISTATGSSGRFTLSYFGKGHATVANRGKILFSLGPSTTGLAAGLAAGSLWSAVVPDDALLAGVMVRAVADRVAGTMELVVIRLDTFEELRGTVVASGTIGIHTGGYSTANAFFYIGEALEADPAALLNPAAAPAAFTGEIDYVGYYASAMSDADALAIAQGADPIALADAATKLSYDRKLRGIDAASLSARVGTADGTAAATVIGAADFGLGSHLRRQAVATYIRFTSRVRDGHCHAISPRNPARMARVDLTVEKAGTTGPVEVAAFNPAGAQLTAWTRMTDAGATASVALPVSAGPFYLIARDSGNTALITTDHTLRRSGYRSVLWSQSPLAIAMFSVKQTLQFTGSGDFSITRYRSEDESQTVETHIASPGVFYVSDAFVTGANQWARRFPGNPLEIIAFTDSGTLNSEVLYDANPGRMWSELLTLLDASGSRIISSVSHSHGNSESGAAENFDITILEPVVWGDKPDLSGGNTFIVGATTYSVANGNADAVPAPDHYIGDGDLQGDFTVAISAVNRTNSFGANAAYDGTRNAVIDFTASAGPSVILGPEMGLMTTGGSVAPGYAGGPHPDEFHLFGTPYLGVYAFELIARSVGLSALQDPWIEAITANAGRTKLLGTVKMINGGKLITADEALWRANVQGFEISEDGGVTWTDRLGRDAANAWAVTGPVFTARLTGSRFFELERAAGAFPAAVKVRYLYGTPLSTPDPTNDEDDRVTMGAMFDTSPVWDRGAAGLLGCAVRKLKPFTVA